MVLSLESPSNPLSLFSDLALSEPLAPSSAGSCFRIMYLTAHMAHINEASDHLAQDQK